MLNKKELEILSFILKEGREIPVQKISEYFSISDRNVRYEIEKIQEELSKEKIAISLSKGKVYFDEQEALEKYLKTRVTYVFSVKERELYLLLLICFQRELKQNTAMDLLDISRSSMKTHLKEIRNLLEKYNLELKFIPKKGLRLLGEEEKVRQCVLKALYLTKKENSSFLEGVVENFFQGIDRKGIELFINYCQKHMDKVISDEAYEIIRRYLTIVVYFCREGYLLEKIQNENFLSHTLEYQAIKEGKVLLEATYDIHLPEIEYCKIADYFLGSHTYNISYSYYENWVEIEIIVQKFIDRVSKQLDVNVAQDKTLILGLVNHIKPMIYRIKNGIELENSIYMEVLESYPQLYQIVKNSVEELEDFIEAKFTKDELAFMTIHFKAALDRNSKRKHEKIKILLLCSSGYGSSKLLAQQIEEMYQVEIVDIIPKYRLKKYQDREDIALILSTVDVGEEECRHEVLQLNPILRKEDIENLDSYPLPRGNKKILFSELVSIIEEHTEVREKDALLKSLKEFLGKKLIDDICQNSVKSFDLLLGNRVLAEGKARTWREAIVEAGNLLLRDGCISEEYIEDMLAVVEEFGDYILFIPNSIFPHAKSSHTTLQTAFAVVCYPKPISLNQIQFQRVIAFCSRDGQEHLDFLVHITEKLKNHKMLLQLKDEKALKKYFTN